MLAGAACEVQGWLGPGFQLGYAKTIQCVPWARVLNARLVGYADLNTLHIHSVARAIETVKAGMEGP